MAMQLLWFNWLSKKEREEYNPDERMFIELHQEWHKKHWIKLAMILTQKARQEEEEKATVYACKIMMAKGFTIKDVARFETTYRIFKSFGLTLEQYIEMLKSRCSDSVTNINNAKVEKEN